LSSDTGVAVLQSLVFSFRTASLWSLMTMIAMVEGGVGLMFKSLRDYQEEDQKRRRTEQEEAAQNLNEIKQELEQLKAKMK
jgi:hypothetical protein